MRPILKAQHDNRDLRPGHMNPSFGLAVPSYPGLIYRTAVSSQSRRNLPDSLTLTDGIREAEGI